MESVGLVHKKHGVEDRTVSEVARLIPELGKAIQSAMPAGVRHEGVSTAQAKALVYLAEHGRQTMGELAVGLHITTPSATGLINPLAAGGFVERDRSDEDRRIVYVRLSDRAQSMAQGILQLRNDEVRVALEGMSREAQANFLEGLERLAEQFGRGPKHGG